MINRRLNIPHHPIPSLLPSPPSLPSFLTPSLSLVSQPVSYWDFAYQGLPHSPSGGIPLCTDACGGQTHVVECRPLLGAPPLCLLPLPLCLCRAVSVGLSLSLSPSPLARHPVARGVQSTAPTLPASAAEASSVPLRGFSQWVMRNSLGWLRLGWLKICELSFK